MNSQLLKMVSPVVPLSKAPFETPLILKGIKDDTVAEKLEKIGLGIGSEIIRNDDSLELKAVRIRSEKGPVVIGGGMGLKTIVHLDDGRKIPLLEMKPGETGHIEGIIGGKALYNTLKQLGISPNEPIMFERTLPHMNYYTIIKGIGTTVLSEGDAAKLLGRVDGQTLQFALVPSGKEFLVTEILGGQRAQERIKSKGIRPGTILILDNVQNAEHLRLAKHAQTVITTKDGLHLHLPENYGKALLVAKKFI